MEKQFSLLGASASRITAVDGRAMDSAQSAAIMRQKEYTKPLSAPEVGCWLSHKKAWQVIAAADAPYAAVFEDDVVLSSSLSLFMNGIEWIPPDCHCVKIDTSVVDAFHRNKRDLPIAPHYLTEPIGKLLGTGGYVISQHAAKTLLAKSDHLEVPVDIFMFENTDRDLAYLQLHPALCMQAHLYEGQQEIPQSVTNSTINAARMAQKAKRLPFGFKKIRREFMRMLRPLTSRARQLFMAITARAFRYSVTFKD